MKFNYFHQFPFLFSNSLLMGFRRLLIGWSKLLTENTKPLSPPPRVKTDMEAMRENANALNNDWRIVGQSMRQAMQKIVSDANGTVHG